MPKYRTWKRKELLNTNNVFKLDFIPTEERIVCKERPRIAKVRKTD